MRRWIALLVIAPQLARAGGMVLPMHGVHAIERAGALIAGADDADALWLDPAGLAHLAGDGKKSLLFDIAYVAAPVDYTRIDSGGTTLPKVSNQQSGLPIPTVAAALGIGDRLVIAAGIAAPYGGTGKYDPTGPQRYAQVSLAGSQFVMIAVGAAYQVSPRLRVGATVQDVVSHIDSQIVLSGCPGTTVCAPEDPDFDAPTRLQETDWFSPSGSIGVQFDAAERVTLGLAVQAPARVSSQGTLTTRLPASGFFDGASVAGNKATMSFTMPPMIRAGVEVRPTPALRLEAALDVELWSIHDQIDITPDNVRIVNAPAVGTYTIGAMHIPRNYKTSFAPAIGGEYRIGRAVFGAGVSYETAAAPAGTVSVLTVDAPKLIVGLGGGYSDAGWQLGAAIGYAHLSDVNVSLADAKVPQLQPIRDQPAPIFVNAGSYHASYLMAGVRAARTF